jgi:alpha-D-xyloside xylohydrolase
VNRYPRLGLLLALVALAGACTSREAVDTRPWVEQPDGVFISLEAGEFRAVRLQVLEPRVIRVTAMPTGDFSDLPDTMAVTAKPVVGRFRLSEDDGSLRLSTAEISAIVMLDTGRIRFETPDGKVLLEEAGRNAGTGSFSVRQQFMKQAGEGLYGLGQQQDGRVNYAGENIELTTHNLEISIPYLVSSRNYGLLWNNAGISRLGDPRPPQPLSAGFDLVDTHGKAGGLTVRYFDGEELLLERQADDLDYQFLSHANVREVPLPPGAAEAQNLRISWEGMIVPGESGRHELKMYSSGYARLSLDGEQLLDRWRMNWNPWFHNAWVDLEAGRSYQLKLDWTAQGGYFRLLHHGPRADADTHISLASDTGNAVDYFFVAGDSMDEVISGYRRLTGKATMLPRWAFGFWQSRERYTSQDQLLENLQAYRDRGIPIDNIVLDWSYWPVDAWGSHDFDPEFFPDPQAMVDRVHELDAQIMISIWPKFYPETAHYQQLNEAGCLFNKNIEAGNYDWIAPGYLNAFYDAFDADCGHIYWAQIDEKLNRFGFDAWWLDAVEPDMHSNLSVERRKEQMTPNALGTGAQYFNAYALPHAEAVAAGDRAADPDIRTFILTRSGFAGIQRTGSAIWSGDIVSRWSNLREQIAAGIGVGLSGMPYWTMDIGGFTPEDHYRYGANGAVCHFSEMPEQHQAAWQELNLRWFQFGAFTPLFRSHGQNPCREIFNLADPGSEVYDSLVWYMRLRYRLMPYIYTLAGNAHHQDGTLMRGLVMDFPADPKVRDLRDQYLFGPDLLVAPVYTEGATSREVYLPAGADWYDFNSGYRHAGGVTIEADAPLARMPLFVRAGAIVPTGPAIQHSGEGLHAPLTLNVFTGADGSFGIYEDDGLSYGYERGEWSRIPVTWDETTGKLTIGEREGSFPGMAENRVIHVRWIDGAESKPSDFDATPDQSLNYMGEALEISRN